MKLDPISEGDKIFSSVLRSCGSEINSISAFCRMFSTLISETEGQIIVDFMDTANWDRVEAINCDEEAGYLTLYWHDFRNVAENDISTKMNHKFLSYDLIGLFMHFQKAIVINSEKLQAIILQGYVLPKSRIKKLLSVNTQEFEIREDYSFSSAQVTRRFDDYIEELECLYTSMYSAIILPKTTFWTSFDSQKALYMTNYHHCLGKLENVKISLGNCSDNDAETICEKANTIRRILEYNLRVECCYRSMERHITITKSHYNHTLGGLISIVKKIHHVAVVERLNRMADWANELSHDSGKPIKKRTALLLCEEAIVYNNYLIKLLNARK